jgi:uncharacterized protein YkwD/uncharacterized membrane protein required for colicin V production
VSTPLGQLNWLDGIVLLLLLISALDGMRRGLLLGALDLAAAAAGVIVAAILEGPVGEWLARTVTALPTALGHLAAFLIILIVVQVVIGATVGRVVVAIVGALDRTPLGGLDRLLGLAPGLVRGVITVTLFLLPFALGPWVPSLSQGIEQSTVANRLVFGALQVMPAVEATLGQDLQSGGLASLVVAPPEAESDTSQPLPLGPPSGDLVPDADAEARMLTLLNDARSQAGLRPLVADEQLRQVARAHSLEMFQLNYFSHNSPTAGSPFDRMHAAGINFLVAGENLAYAPNVEVAHQGLMNSPGHRANILRPEFGRVGIGVIRSQVQGSMFTQDFTN